MTRSPLTDAAAIAEYEDDISMAAEFLTLAENQELECSRLRSENAELRAALETLLYRATELPQYATHDGLMNAEAIAQARAILERTKK